MSRVNFLLPLLAILVSCGETKEYISVNPSKSSSVLQNVTIDSIQFDGGEQGMFAYPNFSTLEVGDDFYFYGHNQPFNNIDAFNLTDGTMLAPISLEKEGPNGIPEVRGLAVASPDSIIIMSDFRLSMLNTDGQVTSYYHINTYQSKFDGHDPNEAYFWLPERCRLHYDRASGNLYGVNHSMKYGQCDEGRFTKTNLISQLNLKNMTARVLDVFYSDLYRQGASMGFLDKIKTTYTEDKVYYTFAADPNIYTYDLQSGEKEVFGGTSNLTGSKNNTFPYGRCRDIDFKMKHYKNGVEFDRLHFDKYRQLFYRVHLGDIPDQKTNGEFTTRNDKPQILTIFDQELNVVAEIELDKRRYFTDLAFVGPKGLYLPAPVGKENVLAFHVYKFNVTQLNSHETD